MRGVTSQSRSRARWYSTLKLRPETRTSLPLLSRMSRTIKFVCTWAMRVVPTKTSWMGFTQRMFDLLTASRSRIDLPRGRSCSSTW